MFYAAQLSSSFFSALSQNIEEFLDLYHSSSKSHSKDDIDDLSTITGAGLKAPAEALSSIALWCDTELSKFTTEFAAKILSNLTLCSISNVSIESVPSSAMPAAQGMEEDESVEKFHKSIDHYEQKDADGEVICDKPIISDKDRKV